MKLQAAVWKGMRKFSSAQIDWSLPNCHNFNTALPQSKKIILVLFESKGFTFFSFALLISDAIFHHVIEHFYLHFCWSFCAVVKVWYSIDQLSCEGRWKSLDQSSTTSSINKAKRRLFESKCENLRSLSRRSSCKSVGLSSA